MNVLVTVVVILFVTLAMAQVVIFDLTKESEQHLPPSVFRLHKTVGTLESGPPAMLFSVPGGIFHQKAGFSWWYPCLELSWSG